VIYFHGIRGNTGPESKPALAKARSQEQKVMRQRLLAIVRKTGQVKPGGANSAPEGAMGTHTRGMPEGIPWYEPQMRIVLAPRADRGVPATL